MFFNARNPGWLISLFFLTHLLSAYPTASWSIPPIRLDAPRNFVTGAIPSQILPLDLDGDGDLDIAVKASSVSGSPQLELYENPGDGSLLYQSALPLPADNRLIATDLNSDHRTDLLQARAVDAVSGELLILRQQGGFSFASDQMALPFPAGNLCAGNLDGKNGPDLLIGDELPGPAVHLYLADGAGSFLPQGSYDTEQPDRDINHDGVPDSQIPIDVEHCRCRDINGDGLDDLILTNSIFRSIVGSSPFYTTDVVTLLNQGNGNLSLFRIILDPGGGQLGIADMDRDGDLDVVTTGISPTGPDLYDVIVLRNNAGGSFATAERFSSGGALDDVGGMALQDIDNDGYADAGIMLFGPQDGNVNDHLVDHWALLRNLGNGALAPPELYPAGAGILDLVFSNLDAAYGADALSVAGDDHRLSVHYNQAGLFRTPAIISIDDPRATVNGTTPLDLSSGDFNGDGLPDLEAIANHSVLVGDGPDTLILLNGVTGGISMMPQVIDLPREIPLRLITQPIDQEFADDIAVVFLGDSLSGSPESVGLSLGSAGGLPGAMQLASLKGAPAALAALDVDSDGIRDLAVLRIRDEGITAGISIFKVNVDSSLSYLGDLILGSDDIMQFDTRLPYALGTGDMDNDGQADLIATSRNSLGTRNAIVSVIINYGDLSFALAGEFSTVTREVSDVIAADVTGDGLQDVILTTVADLTDPLQDGSLEMLPNLGGGMLGASQSYNVGQGPLRVAAEQIDTADTNIDLAVVNDGSNEITLLINDGSGRFPTQERYLTGGGSDALAIADLDGDGDIDVAVANDDHQLNRHHGSISVLTNLGISTPPCEGDFDRDGDVDGSDLARFSSSFGQTGCTTGPACSGDFDYDGDVDGTDLARFSTNFGRADCPQ